MHDYHRSGARDRQPIDYMPMKYLAAVLFALNLALGATALYFASGAHMQFHERIRAERVDEIRVDVLHGTINVTFGAEGRPDTTLVLTPRAALQAQAGLAQMVLTTVESADALRAAQQQPVRGQ